MQPPKFKYTLIIDGVPTELINAPSGWEETLLNYKRSKAYFGLIRGFTVPLQFTLDGAYLLRNEYYRRGSLAKTVFRIEALKSFDWTYRVVYQGEIDFSEWEDEDNLVNVTVTDVGVAETVASSDRSVYEIVLNESNSELVEIPSVSLIDFMQGLVDPKDYGYGAGYKIMPMGIEQNELINEKVEAQITEEEANANLSTSINWFLQGIENTNIVVSGRLEGTIRFTRFNYNCRIEIRNQSGVLKGTILNAPRSSRTVAFNYSIPMSIEAGEKLFTVLSFTGGEGSVELWTSDFFPIRVTNEVLSNPFNARAISGFNLFQTLIDLMNEKETEVESIFLKTSNLWFTCGDAIRGFENPVIKTSFESFFKTVDATHSLGFGIDGGKPRLELKEFFIREVPSFNFGKVKSFKLESANEFIFTSLKVGYKEESYEENQGREEFNQGQVWNVNNKKSDSVIERISAYRADMFGIAVLRRLEITDNLRGLDTESDNGVWILQGSGLKDGAVNLLEKGSDYDFISGISNQENQININLSPKRCLLRAGGFIGIGLYDWRDQSLKFGSAEKNANLLSIKDGLSVLERQDIQVSNLKKRHFLPHLVTITVPIRKDDWSLIDVNIYGYFTFEYRGNQFKGYIEEASNNIAEGSEREIKLYLHADTNLQALIL